MKVKNTIKVNPLEKLPNTPSKEKEGKVFLPNQKASININNTNGDLKNSPIQPKLEERNMANATQMLDDELKQETVSEDKSPQTLNSLQKQLAMETVKKWSTWSAAAGFIPTPIIDTAAISAIQLKMVHSICRVYDVEFKKEVVIAIITSLVGGAVATTLAGTTQGQVAKLIPGIGTFVSSLVQPGTAYATTYALGRVFIDHFDKEGTLLNFDTSKVKNTFKNQYDGAKKLFTKDKTVADIPA
jgi:uncharacterized protein (DUF697 family)